MLVLSRRKSEKLILPDLDIEITIVEIRGDKVRIGIDAPKDVKVYREEIYQAILEEENENEG